MLLCLYYRQVCRACFCLTQWAGSALQLIFFCFAQCTFRFRLTCAMIHFKSLQSYFERLSNGQISFNFRNSCVKSVIFVNILSVLVINLRSFCWKSADRKVNSTDRDHTAWMCNVIMICIGHKRVKKGFLDLF